MFLKRFVFINWGNIPNVEFDFGPINLFSGGNGSGKTTAADAIQTVMTAAHENLFQYNPGQDETTQRGRGGKRVRTISSYVLGCDDGSFARLDPTDGYLAAVFYPNHGEVAEPFTAIVAVRAWLDLSGSNTVARQDAAQFYIVPGVELEHRHFIREGAGERYVVALTQLQTLLIQEYGKSCVERYDTKKAYLRRLYGALRAKSDAVSEVEAIAAARAFSRFMAYKPVKSINRFVADEILEQRDLGEAIRSVSSQLKTIHGMEQDAAQLLESIKIINKAKDYSQCYIDNWIELNLIDYKLARAEYKLRQQDYLKGKSQQKDKHNQLGEVDKKIEEVRKQVKAMQQQLISLEAKRQGIDALRQKDELENKSQDLNDSLVTSVRTVFEQDKIVTGNIQSTREIIHALVDKDIAEALPFLSGLEELAIGKTVVESGQNALQDIHDLLQRDIVDSVSVIEERFDALQQIQIDQNLWFDLWHDQREDACFRDQLANFVHVRKTRYNLLTNHRDDKKREISRLNANKVTYPAYVDRAIKAIRHLCPQADPRVLCDYVDVKDALWQASIEGYLGGARFSIIVDEEFEKEAIRIVRRMPGRDNRAKVIQGQKSAEDAARAAIHENSIIHVLEFSHETARTYLTASYGSVLRVNSTEELRKTRRGITEDGMGSGGYSMWRCDLSDSELVFGIAARERALAAKMDELESIEQEWHAANDKFQRGKALLRAADDLTRSAYGDVLRKVLSIYRTLQENEEMLKQLDLTEHKDLEDRLKELQQKHEYLYTEEGDLNIEKGQLKTELASIEKQIKALSHLQEKNQENLEVHQKALESIIRIWPDFDIDTCLDTTDKEANELDIELVRNQREEVEKELHSAERRAAEEIMNHNQSCRPSDAIVYASFSGEYGTDLFKAICGIRGELDRVYNILKNNVLVEKHKQLAELKESFNNAFVSHLCHAIYQALSEGKRQIDLLNKELQHHQFGADRETFRFASEWMPEYRDYSRFFEEVVKTPGIGDEFSLFDAEMSEKSIRVRDELMSKLLDEDELRAMRDLERIADYRNYRRYEIYKEVEGKDPIPLSEYGTGSGGQLETPAYIIRSAAITSAFRFSEGKSHLRMVLVDEAFSKMDETRSREVIQYLTESLGLQLLFIMPTSKCGPFMDLISNEFVFAKVPSEVKRGQLSSRVLVDRKQCNQARIKELWNTHKRSIYQQAELDFMEEFAAE